MGYKKFLRNNFCLAQASRAAGECTPFSWQHLCCSGHLHQLEIVLWEKKDAVTQIAAKGLLLSYPQHWGFRMLDFRRKAGSMQVRNALMGVTYRGL